MKSANITCLQGRRRLVKSDPAMYPRVPNVQQGASRMRRSDVSSPKR